MDKNKFSYQTHGNSLTNGANGITGGSPLSNSLIARLIRVYGIVQGVGFRPFVARIADKNNIAGSVCNKGPFVEIYAQGKEEDVASFLHSLKHDAPERSAILKVEIEEIEHLAARDGKQGITGSGCGADGNKPQEGKAQGVAGGEKREEQGSVGNKAQGTAGCAAGSAFKIIQSEKVGGNIFVSPDIATCSKCRAELFDPHDRRYLHPFINCTACGPRLTILDSMPYDRVRTSMKDFPMCDKCNWEYTTPSTRRYHAQPVCCTDCGPRLILIHPEGLRGKSDAEAITMTRAVIRSGGIAAIKGIGGFHLCCDALNDKAVARLRQLKDRKAKPFAVMMRDMEAVRRECVVSSEKQEAILTGPNKPILLLDRKEGSTISPLAAPDNPRVGVMLPYAPVQMLLFDYPDGKPFSDALIMTSGNLRGAPICRTDEDALETLRQYTDIILSNDRVIRLRADDSVMAWDSKRDSPAMIRRSRGYAPLPVMLGLAEGAATVPSLAIGGELKNTFCLASDGLYYLSPYIGDMADIRSVEALGAAITRMERLLEITPRLVVCDKHPLYNTVQVARELSEERGIPLLQVQHHWAHVASCMAENGWTQEDGPVIGIAFDGTGYGDDGTIWGGEVLVCDYKNSRRAASIEPFAQAGGDMSSRQGWRIACSLLDDEAVCALHLSSEAELSTLRFMIRGHINTVTSTSCGRLFDAVSAILGLCRESSFEGEAAMRLQAKAEEYAKQGAEDSGQGGGDSGQMVEEGRWGAMNKGQGAGDSEGKRMASTHQTKPRVTVDSDEEAANESVDSRPWIADSGQEIVNNAQWIGEGRRDSGQGTVDGRQWIGGSGQDGGTFVMATTRLVQEIASRAIAGEDAAYLAYYFHDALSCMVVEASQYCRENSTRFIQQDTLAQGTLARHTPPQAEHSLAINTVALTGGVFNNMLLRSLCRKKLEASGFRVLVHTLIPAGDGGIALGQAAIAAAQGT